MKTVQLSPLERVQLINQYTILKIVQKTTDYDALIEALRSGYEIFYDDVFNGLYEPMPEDDSHRVLDVLDMFRALEVFLEKNPKHALASDFAARFQGYDGNHEGRHLSFVRHIVYERDLFTELKARKTQTDNFNSHTRMIDRYNAMFDVWVRLGKNFELTVEQAMEIVAAARP